MSPHGELIAWCFWCLLSQGSGQDHGEAEATQRRRRGHLRRHDQEGGEEGQPAGDLSHGSVCAGVSRGGDGVRTPGPLQPAHHQKAEDIRSAAFILVIWSAALYLLYFIPVFTPWQYLVKMHFYLLTLIQKKLFLLFHVLL